MKTAEEMFKITKKSYKKREKTRIPKILKEIEKQIKEEAKTGTSSLHYIFYSKDLKYKQTIIDILESYGYEIEECFYPFSIDIYWK